MKRYAEYKKNVEIVEKVEPEYVYYAYKNGTATLCHTSDEAKSISKNWESVVANEEQVKAAKLAIRTNEKKILDAWLSDLKEEFFADYPHLNHNKVFEMIYERAYDRGHSAGMDEVSDYFWEEADFVDAIMRFLK